MSKVKKRALSLLLAVLMVFNLVPNMPMIIANAAEGVKLVIDDQIEYLTTAIGSKGYIKGHATMSNATASDVPWSATDSDATITATSSDAAVAEVGEITFDKKTGKFSVEVIATNDVLSKPETAIITIGYSDLYGNNTNIESKKITVNPEGGEGNAIVTDVQLLAENAYLKSGESTKLTATVTASPANAAKDFVIHWSSSNENVVPIPKNSDGESVITVTAGAVTEEVEVRVKAEAGNNYREALLHISPATPDVNHVTGVELNAKTKTLYLNSENQKTFQLTATVAPEDADDKTVTWTSSKPEVATVEDGFVTAVGTGNTTITVKTKDGGLVATCEVTVENEVRPAETIKLNHAELTLVEGKTQKLNATVTPENFTDTIVWKSENEDVATVDQDGTVTAVSKGDTTITATAGDVSAICEVNVLRPLKSVTIIGADGKEIVKTSLKKATTMDLYAELLPEDPSDNEVIWSSSNEKVATVDKNGMVTAVEVAEEAAVITASVKTSTGEVIAATCEIEVVEDAIPVTGITLDETLALDKDTSKTLEPVVLPVNATNKAVKWSTSDEKIATVDEKGVVTGKAVGTAVITATTEDGAKTASCVVTVKDLIFSLSRTEVTMQLGVLDTKTLKATINMTKVDDTKEAALNRIQWTSSNNEVATVDNGEVTIHKAGTATIKATLDGITKTCVITVKAADAQITGNDPAVQADALQKDVAEIAKMEDPEEQVKAIKAVVGKASNILTKVSNNTSLDTNAIAAISELEASLADVVDFIEELDMSDVADVPGFDTDTIEVAGALLNALDLALNQGETEPVNVRPVLAVKPVPEEEAADKISNTVQPKEDEVAPVAMDISLILEVGDKKVTEFSKPIIITMKMPESFAGKTKVVMWHFHEGSNPDKLRVKVDSSFNMSFSVNRFSTFILAEGTASSGKTNGGGHGGNGGHSSSGGISTGNLAGTWVQDATGWWFKTTTNGFPANEWAKINNKWYHFNEAGYMQTGWINISNVWYYLNADGSMADNTWVLLNDKWYYLNVGGGMLASQWFQYKSQWYYLNADGSMAVSTTTPDGNAVDANGVWVQ